MNDLEGIIQFRCSWSTGPPLPSRQFDQIVPIWSLARDYRWIGIDENGIGYGNLSFRDEEDCSAFWITGTQISLLPQLTPEYFTRVIKVDIAQNSVDCIGLVKPSSETMTHAAVYLGNPAVKVVLHIHNHLLWAVLQRTYYITPKESKNGTPALAQEVLKLACNLSLPSVIVMLGHENGLIICASSLAQLVEQMNDLRSREIESACESG